MSDARIPVPMPLSVIRVRVGLSLWLSGWVQVLSERIVGVSSEVSTK